MSINFTGTNIRKYADPEIFKYMDKRQQDKKRKAKVAVASVVGSSIGVVSAATILSLAVKRNPKSIKKLISNIASTDYKAKEIIAVGTGSILGGLTAGMITDKKDTHKAKVREGIQQLCANLLIPIGALTGVRKITDKTIWKNLDPTKKLTKGQLTAKAGIVVGTLLLATKVGNVMMEKVNNVIFRENKERDLNAKDLCANLDDISYSLPFITNNTAVNNVASKALPFTLLIPGIETGTKQ